MGLGEDVGGEQVGGLCLIMLGSCLWRVKAGLWNLYPYWPCPRAETGSNSSCRDCHSAR